MKGAQESGMSKLSSVAGTIRELDPQIIEVSTSGVSFPASKSELIERAKGTDAPQVVIDALDKFEDRQYIDPEDIKSEFNKILNK
ncbi:MAG: DUF2795 domain-containing protein [Methanomicrobiales archaeon]|jgi:hypothetical protein|nr:DUF2795 domain-containing protein [Methanomicrobiales archaeon]